MLSVKNAWEKKKKKVALKNPAMEQHKLAYKTYIQDTFTLVEQNLRVTL